MLTEIYPWIHEALCALPAAEAEYQPEWLATKYMLRGKMFAMLGGDKEEKPILTLKLPPEQGDFLRRQYPGRVIPGHYMNKLHWNSIYLEDCAVPRAEMLALMQEAHATLLKTLPKKAQAEIQGV